MSASGGTSSPLAAQRNEKMPIIARRPLFTSISSRRSFVASVILKRPKGSYRSKGTGCGRSTPT